MLRDDRPTAVFEGRLALAEDLWRGGLAPRILVTGGFTGAARVSEAEAGKAWLLAQCIVPGLMFPQRYPSPALPATAFLVDAVAATPAPARPLVPRPGLVARLLGTAEMFQRLKQLERHDGEVRRHPHA